MHKYATEIKAWADGAAIEFNISKKGDPDKWMVIKHPQWYSGIEYRIKKEELKQYVRMDIGECKFTSFESEEPNMVVTCDSHTHKLIKVELL